MTHRKNVSPPRRFMGLGVLHLSLLSSALSFGGCSGSQTSGAAPSSEEGASAPRAEGPAAPEGDQTEREGSPLADPNQFGFDLYAQLREAPGDLVFSPASVQVALGMASAGARGETARQMARVLFAGEPGAAQHETFGAAVRSWNTTTERSVLRVANRIFADRTVALEPGFVELTRDVYGAPVRRVDFIQAFEPARVEINRWVAEQTEDRIRDLLPQGALDTLTRLVLTNAVYFKGTWETEFDPARTRPRDFWVGGAEAASVQTMETKAEFAWARLRDEGLSILEMPYAGGEQSMVWLLPEARDGLSALEQKLSPEALGRWREAAREAEVEVRLPRFKLESGTLAMSRPLAALGMTLPFGHDADFRGMASSPDDLYIQEVFHKAFIEVNEEGTEAAAATAVVMATRAAGPARDVPPRFIAEHPFIFALMDRRTGAVLFLGRVVDPR